MGCGQSNVRPGEETANTPRSRPVEDSKTNGYVGSVEKENLKNRKKTTDSNSNRKETNNNAAVQKSVAFAVTLDGQETESLIKKHPPLKLQRLDPLNVPTLTPEMLIEKQRLADEKRDKELQRKVSASRKSSKRRRELMMAKEFEQQQQQTLLEAEENKLKAAEKLREARLNEIKEKQRMREERARRAREKAKRMQNADQEDLGNIEVEKDDQFNAGDDEDSWTGDTNNNRGADNSSYDGDKIYSGRSSPRKNFDENQSNYRHPSASTVDSFDNAYNRKPVSASAPRQSQVQEEADDDFFS